MAEFRYRLEKYTGKKSRHTCPGCNQPGVFSRYVDTVTNEYLSDAVGRCNREDKCGYHYRPSEFFKDTPDAWRSVRPGSPIPEKLQSRSFDTLPYEVVPKSVSHSPKSHFHSFLSSCYGAEVSNQKTEQYLVGSSNTDPYATIFFQIDITYKVRSGKLIVYDPLTGKRRGKINWVHSKIAHKTKQSYTLKQCFFGEHLLAANLGKTVAITESEKTAIIASIFLPEFVWIATGGVYGCGWRDRSVSDILLGRTVVLFPDLNMFERWSGYAEGLKKQLPLDIHVSDLLERSATKAEKESKIGYDLADYLLKLNHKPL